MWSGLEPNIKPMKTNRLFQFLLLISLLFLQTCKEIEKQMAVSTLTVSNIELSKADVSGKILDIGEGISSYGHCYATIPNVTIAANKTVISVQATNGFSFTSVLTGLTPSTKYYVKAYCSRGSETVYGDEISFTTLSDTKPEISTTAVTDVTKTEAKTGGNITSEGGTPVTARGVCWSTLTNPVIEGNPNKTNNGAGTGTFISNINGLTEGVKYYVRAYATNLGGTSYGNEVSFTTVIDLPPTVVTASVSSYTSISAVCGGEVTSEGSTHVTARGVCYGNTNNPDISGNKTLNGEGLGTFTSNISGLNPGTTYYVRAYATNSINTSYGNEVSFKTSPVPPTLTTAAATQITYNSAKSGGNVTSDGGAAVTAYGVCWNTSQNPTVSNNHTTDGSGTGSFTSNLTGLSPSTNYWIRAYATNSAGTSYGGQQPFTTAAAPYITVTSPVTGDHWMELENRIITWTSNITSDNVSISLYKASSLLLTISSNTPNDGSYTWTLPDNLTYGSDYKIRITSLTIITAYGDSPLFKISESSGSTGTVSDADGFTYNTIKIGKQWWTKQNLKTTRYNDFSFVPWQGNITTWLTLTTGAYCYYENNSSYLSTYGALYNWYAVNSGKLCPVGWHVPSIAEWDELVAFTGGESIAGGKLKETGTTHWASPNTGADDAYGFTGLPGGYLIDSKGFANRTNTGFFWSSATYSSTHSAYLKMEYNISGIVKANAPKYGGMSVRCVRD